MVAGGSLVTPAGGQLRNPAASSTAGAVAMVRPSVGACAASAVAWTAEEEEEEEEVSRSPLGPEAMELNRRIKLALDPEGILNPGAAI